MRAVIVLDESGFAAVPGALAVDQCVELVTALDGAGSGQAGYRNLLDVSACQQLAATFKAHTQVGPLLPHGAVAVQCAFFDKSADNNWLVALHQDLSIPIQERVAHPDCSGWSKRRVFYTSSRQWLCWSRSLPCARTSMTAGRRMARSASSQGRIGTVACLQRQPGHCASSVARSSASLAGVMSWQCGRFCFTRRPRLRPRLPDACCISFSDQGRCHAG